MNLVYMCVFYQTNYIHLLKLLVRSIHERSKLNKETTDVLVMTSPYFHPYIQYELKEFDLPIKYHILDLNTLMEASCCKLRIFQYEDVDKYEKILYVDTDVLINSDINVLFDTHVSPEKMYALEEGHTGHEFWGSQFFEPGHDLPAFSAGVFYFINSPSMKKLFQDTNDHIASYSGQIPTCLDQPFLVYNSFVQGKYDNQMMKSYMENNPDVVDSSKIIYHFPGGPGNFPSKHHKMTSFWNKMAGFETRNEMMKYYCSQLTKPTVLEIGVFRGEFLDYVVNNCNIGQIDAVDLFEGVTCSGDADGNNVIEYDVGKSYLALTDKYKDATNVRLHKSDSVTFLQAQDDDTYDVIYVDGDHSYNGVKQDLTHAYKKIKNKGYIMGHDYEMNTKKARHSYDFGVKQAVNEFCSDYNQSIESFAMDGCVSYCIRINKNRS